MRELVVSKAPLQHVAQVTKGIVEEMGGVVAHHTVAKTEFDHLQPREDTWSRSGYVGTYQRYKEEPVRLRIRVWASWPRRLFLWSVYAGLIEAVVFFLMSFVGVPPSPNVWILTAILTFLAIGITLLMYSTSWADSADMEDDLARELGSYLQTDDEIPGDVYTLADWEEHRQDLIEEKVSLAEAEAPERPGVVAKLKQRAAAGDEDEEGRTTSASLLARFRSGDEEPQEPEEPDQEPAQAGPDEEPEEEDEAASGGLMTRLRSKFPSRSSDDEDEDEDADVDEPEAPEEDEPGLLSRMRSKLPGTSSEADDDDEPSQDDASPDAEPGQADEPADETEDAEDTEDTEEAEPPEEPVSAEDDGETRSTEDDEETRD